MSKTNYEPDEFDEAAQNGPRGVHRAPEPWWRWMVPFLVVLLLVPIVAWGSMYLLTNNGADLPSRLKPSTAESTVSATTEAAPSAEAPKADEPAKPVEATQEATEEKPAADKANADIVVLNGASVNGLAASVVAKLKDAGFKEGTAANANGWASKTSVVYYPSDEYKALAEEAAKTLGIEEVKSYPEAPNKKGITVLLRKDYRQ
ncbi:LytR C-terminal domain-containing protein [Boudabousia liubingyangii]|uniref:LytR C-terminal domain-containing protein n=1 Tax=Boudabousia liubingyangii TaxID=1921764 RepID=UPI00093FA626|nr:LytR C-terminal domain-containing protein [Boudabousia liubingyangii]